jgi:hypothetical protein
MEEQETIRTWHWGKTMSDIREAVDRAPCRVLTNAELQITSQHLHVLLVAVGQQLREPRPEAYTTTVRSATASSAALCRTGFMGLLQEHQGGQRVWRR